MARLLDVIALTLLVSAAGAFVHGLNALGAQRDAEALYVLCVGGLMLWAAKDLIRPRTGAG